VSVACVTCCVFFFQSAYVHSSINDASVLVVFELVAKCSRDEAGDGTASDDVVGCGFGFISLFRRSVRSIDVSDLSASPAVKYRTFTSLFI